MRLRGEGNAFPRINPLMAGYQELPGKGFESQGPSWASQTSGGMKRADWGQRVSPGGGRAERRVQYGWPGYQGLVEDVDDRPGPTKRNQTSVPQACPRPGQSPGSGFHGPDSEGGQNWGFMQTGTEERGPHPPLPWLTSAAQCGLTGSPPAGLGRSSHPRPSAHSGSSQRWSTQAVPAALHGLPGGGGRWWGQALGKVPENRAHGE